MSKSSYQVIARRWRPKQFSELVGQDHIVRTLGNAIEMDRIAHAYLFVGPRGTGKTTSARLFAKSLNWEDGPSLEVPEDSEIGNAIMEGRCLDVIEIDGASNNSVDQVRDLRDECQYAPAQCRYKIYVIDEVHMLSQAAFNALLKTLEEPPPHVKFVFATTEANKVLPTISSRCQRFEFRSIPSELIVQKLKYICEKESVEVEEDALMAIARIAMGGMRDAQSILDQMISFCESKVSHESVLEIYGLVADERIARLGDFIIKGNYQDLLDEVEAFAEEGVDFYRLLMDLAEYFRTFLVSCIKDEKSNYPEQAARILDVLKDGEHLVRNGLSEKTNFEVTLLRAVEAGRSRSIDAIIRQISRVLPNDSKKKTIDAVDSESSDLVGRYESKLQTGTQKENEATDKTFNLVVEEKGSDEASIGSDFKEKQKDLKLGNEKSLKNSSEGFEDEEDKITDPGLIEERKAQLPQNLRNILDDKLRADFISIEKIDKRLLL